MDWPRVSAACDRMAPKILGIGELLWDVLPSGPRLGGALANFAVFCARLGNRPDWFLASVTMITADDARGLLLQPNLDLQQLQQSDSLSDGNGRGYFSADEQPQIHHLLRGWHGTSFDLTPGVLEAARAADAVCFGTLAQRHEVSRSTIRRS